MMNNESVSFLAGLPLLSRLKRLWQRANSLDRSTGKYLGTPNTDKFARFTEKDSTLTSRCTSVQLSWLSNWVKLPDSTICEIFTYNSGRSEVHKVGLVILLACITLGFGNPVLARERGEAHRGAGGAKTEKRDAPVLGLKSQKANENSNAQWSSGATTGQDRAALRRQGRGNDKAQTDQGTQRRHSRYR